MKVTDTQLMLVQWAVTLWLPAFALVMLADEARRLIRWRRGGRWMS